LPFTPSAEQTMGMQATLPPKRWTAAEVRALIGASPMSHQRIVQALLFAIAPYVASERVGEAFGVHGDVELEVEQIVQPDLFVIPEGPGQRARSWSDVASLLLAVEVF
jgi:hypothetical protein